MLNFKREQGIEQAKQLVLENLNPTLQEKLHVTQTRVETFLSRDKQVFWNLTKNILKIIEPDFFINDDTKTFGQFETQVFPNVHSEINFAVNFSHRLDYTKRDTIHMYYKDKKALRRQPAAYNPQSAFGKRVLATALELKTPPTHLIIKALKLKAGLRGRVRVSLYKQTISTSALFVLLLAMKEKSWIFLRKYFLIILSVQNQFVIIVLPIC